MGSYRYEILRETTTDSLIMEKQHKGEENEQQRIWN